MSAEQHIVAALRAAITGGALDGIWAAAAAAVGAAA